MENVKAIKSYNPQQLGHCTANNVLQALRYLYEMSLNEQSFEQNVHSLVQAVKDEKELERYDNAKFKLR